MRCKSLPYIHREFSCKAVCESPHLPKLLSNIRQRDTVDHFTFWISFSLRLSWSPKFGLSPKVSKKSFFVWIQRIAQRFAERLQNPELTHQLVKVMGQRQLNMHIIFKSVLMLLTENYQN